MGTFDSHNDAPDQIRQEGEEITLDFERTSDTTGVVNWNIPSPAAGCTSENQAYCGIVVLLNTVPNKPVQTWPQDGTRYTADPTADGDLHAGDKIGGALVVGAFYNDKTTTSLQVTNLNPEQTYFFTGHAVSCELFYHQQGVSSYALPYAYTDPTPDTAAYHEITINQNQGGIQPESQTNLNPGQIYGIDVRIDDKNYDLMIDGSNAPTYQKLVDEINRQIKLLDEPPQSPVPPNTGAYYYDATNERLYQWDGFQHNDIPVISDNDQPNLIKRGNYWLNTSSNNLFFREFAGSPPTAGSPRVTEWTQLTPLVSGFDPNNPECDVFWFDNSLNNGYKWNGDVWCSLQTFVQTNDPSCAPNIDCGSYWYDETNEMLFAWNEETESWQQIEAIVWPTDPTVQLVGTYWFNDISNELFQYQSGSPSWNKLDVFVGTTSPTATYNGNYWYNPETQELFEKEAGSPEWIVVDVLIAGKDPQSPDSCDYWWNTTTNKLFTWNTVGASSWTEVSNFFISDIDPSQPVLPDTGAMWVDNSNPSNLVFWEWDGSQFVLIPETNRITFTVNPISFVNDGVVWFDNFTNQYFVRSGTQWVKIDPIRSTTDPATPSVGSFWYNTSNSTLNTWNGINWVNVAFSFNSQKPANGTLWYDTNEKELKSWNGTEWVVAVPRARVTLNDSRGCYPQGNIIFTTTTEGSHGNIRIGTITGAGGLRFFNENIQYRFSGDLFESLTSTTNLQNPVGGGDGLTGTPSYDEIGVGTTGDPAFRRELADSIRKQLGYPVVEVELTKYQINEAIQSALEELRTRSSAAYRRVYFFLNVQPNVQKYVMTNERVGFNTIVNVMGIHRVTSAFLSTVYAAGVYGQTTLQHLYHMGTFDLVSYHIIADYIEQLEQLFATRVTYTWHEASRELYIFQRFTRRERVLVDAIVEKTEQELMVDRYVKTWIERWALAQCQLTLAQIRGKYATLPGAGGGVSLNAADLNQMAQDNIRWCIEDIDNLIVNDVENLGIGSEVIIG